MPYTSCTVNHLFKRSIFVQFEISEAFGGLFQFPFHQLFEIYNLRNIFEVTTRYVNYVVIFGTGFFYELIT